MALYDDGTIPSSTQALGAVAEALGQSAAGQGAWSHFNSRSGYRPFDLAVGAARPTIAYKNLRGFVNAVVKLLAPDSNPYDPAPKKDAQGHRIPTPGAAYAQMSAMSAAVHADLANETADPLPSPLVLSKTIDATTGAPVLNRPMTDLETIQSVLFAQDPTFGERAVRDGHGSRQRAALHRAARPARLRRRRLEQRDRFPRRSWSDPTACPRWTTSGASSRATGRRPRRRSLSVPQT